jgi:predicted Fe-Mo cluster-binding NifX family protein
MKIVISATGASLDSDVEPRFGRCPYFIVADPETLEFEAVDNSATMAAGGAGIAAAQAIANKGAEAVLTGNCGPNAYQVLSAAGFRIITGISGKIKDAIELYRSGNFKTSEQANVPDHFGTGQGPAAGIGSGMRMGKGCGSGKAGGRANVTPFNAGTQPFKSGHELKDLKEQTQTMAQQLADLQRKIEELEDK